MCAIIAPHSFCTDCRHHKRVVRVIAGHLKMRARAWLLVPLLARREFGRLGRCPSNQKRAALRQSIGGELTVRV